MRNQHSRNILISLWVLLALALSACGGSGGAAPVADASDEAASEAGDEVASGDTCVVGFSQATMNHPWRVAMVEGNQTYAEENLPNMELIVTDGQNDAGKQVSDVESLLAQGVDVLLLSPLTEDALSPVAQQAMGQGVPVLTLDRKVNTEVTAHIGAENRPIGEAAAAFVSEQLGGEGRIIEIQGTAGASATVDRHEGFADAIAGSGLEVVAEQHADYLREGAVTFMEDMLQRFGPGEFDAVYAHNDEMALGAVTALREAGRAEDVIVVGIDGQNNAIEAVKSGDLAATFIYPFVAPDGVEYADQVCRGEQIDAEIVLESQRIDGTNVDEWIGKGF
jgi:ribose transport system substrate-binding protein